MRLHSTPDVLTVLAAVLGVVLTGVLAGVLAGVLVTTALLSSSDESLPPQPERAIKANDSVSKAKGEGLVSMVMVVGVHALIKKIAIKVF
jgi:MFS superfamily sulfate permease-like transporter